MLVAKIVDSDPLKLRIINNTFRCEKPMPATFPIQMITVKPIEGSPEGVNGTIETIHEITFHLEGCSIESLDGRWPISIVETTPGILEIKIVNARIVAQPGSAMGQPPS